MAEGFNMAEDRGKLVPLDYFDRSDGDLSTLAQAEALSISAFHQPRVKAIAASLGVPAQKCVDEALEDWLTIVAPARIEEAISQGERKPPRRHTDPSRGLSLLHKRA